MDSWFRGTIFRGISGNKRAFSVDLSGLGLVLTGLSHHGRDTGGIMVMPGMGQVVAAVSEGRIHAHTELGSRGRWSASRFFRWPELHDCGGLVQWW